MQILYDNFEYAQMLIDIANKYPTYYAWGAIGAPVDYKNNRSRYNVPKAPNGSFLFDCSGFVYKAIPLGWYGDPNRVYGGADPAKYPELYNCNDILSICTSVSDDFSDIEVSEVLYMSGHVGLYIGGGKCVESTSAWTCGCLFSEVQNCGIDTGLPYKRKWLKHGKMPFIKYLKNPVDPVNPDKVQLEQEKIDQIRGLLDELEAIIHD